MTTILGLMQTIKDSVADLEQHLLYLEQPFAGFLDEEIEHREQVEQERNIDHANDNRI